MKRKDEKDGDERLENNFHHADDDEILKAMNKTIRYQNLP